VTIALKAGLTSFAGILGLIVVSSPATAQERNLPRAHAFEVTVGLMREAAADLGTSEATLTTPAGAPLALFKTSTRLEAASSIALRAAYNLSRMFAVEAGFSRTRPELRIQVSNDLESTPPSPISSRAYWLYHFDGTFVVHFPNVLPRARLTPYVFAGAGHTRQLAGGSVLLETGATFQAGTGAKYFFASRPSGFLRGAGVRGEAQWRRTGPGLDLLDEARITFSATLGGIVAF
jgi:hypothetical protein